MLLMSESYIDVTRGLRCGDTEPYEPFTDNIKRLFLSCQREFGRCVSKVYVDQADKEAMAIGWVFQKRVKYSDCNETYLQETWITLHDSKPIRTVTHHYHAL